MFVFVDECGTHTSMTRLRARAPRGERAHGRVPRNRGRNTTLLASMGAGGMGPCMTVVGSTTKAVFEAYVERVLAPSLYPGQMVTTATPLNVVSFMRVGTGPLFWICDPSPISGLFGSSGCRVIVWLHREG